MYDQSKLWKRVMTKGAYKKERVYLCVEYEKAYKRAALLAGEINRYLPDFTVHDITHVDALWKMVDIFLPDNYNLNPLEVFVLGVSFLIHDLGMGLVAYSEGVESIRNEQVWRDTVACLCKKNCTKYNFDNFESIDSDIQRQATEIALRTLHDRKAKDLAKIGWHVANNVESLYIIDDDDLRSGYGEIIGLIAASHGWSIEDVVKKFSEPVGNISSFPTDWNVNPLVVACILRLADAMNIDDSRAPRLLRAVRSLNKESELHWIFQEKLHQAQVKNHRLVYTSKSAFTSNEREAWWLCYDMLKWIDVEIRRIDSALLNKGLTSFGLVGVYCIDNLNDLTACIKVDGWLPANVNIQVTKVAAIINSLGGKALYGSAKMIPLRELIQNAADAIRARKCLEKDDDGIGTIVISLGEEEGQKYIEVKDNGIGMSSKTMESALLDFGCSFWKTDAMHNEFPGLEQTSFQSTGQFGIGFFSVFMWGDKVVVRSRRYKDAQKDTTVLEFESGIEKRPFIRPANENEYIENGGTVIRIYLYQKEYDDVFGKGSIIKLGDDSLRYAHTLEMLCLCLDCNLDFEYRGEKKRIIQANDWIDMDSLSLYKRFYSYGVINEQGVLPFADYQLSNLQHIYFEKECIGRMCVVPANYMMGERGIIQVGGLICAYLATGVMGVIKGKVINAARDKAMPIIQQEIIDKWVEDQALLLMKNGNDLALKCAPVLCSLSDINTQVAIARTKSGFVNYNEIVEKVQRESQCEYYIFQIVGPDPKKMFDDRYYNFDNSFMCLDDYYNYHDGDVRLLNNNDNPLHLEKKKGIVKRIIMAIAEGWNMPEERINVREYLHGSCIYDDNDDGFMKYHVTIKNE